MKPNKITKILAREILDSRGNPTVETTVWAGSVSATASVPSGASTGRHEAKELRDGDRKRFGGLGVLKAVGIVNTKLAKVLRGFPVNEQKQLDQLMLTQDSTPHKSRFGANGILSVSLAVAKLSAKLEQKELYSHLAKKYGYKAKNLPTPLFNVINGGKHADSGLDIQEYFIIPKKEKFKDQLRKSVEVYHTLKAIEVKVGMGGLGDEGGFAPRLKNNEAAFEQLLRAIKQAGYKPGRDFNLGIDAASSEFFDSETQTYRLRASKLTYKSASIHQLYEKWQKKYRLAIIEDGCSEDDFAAWKTLTQKLGHKTLIVGDDLFVTNPQRIQLGVNEKIANAVLIKPNQIGTLTETIEAIKLAQKNKYAVIVSHRSGETNDDFIADLAVAVGADYIKAGAPARGERVAKYNRLLEIESKL